MTRTSKLIKCSIGSGKKGTLLIRKSSLSLRRHRVVTITTARAAKKALVSNMVAASPMSVSVGTPIVTSFSSVSTNGTQSTSGMSSLTQESTRYKKHGVTFNEFIEGNGADWRKFGCITYDEMKSSGYDDLLMKRINDYFKARTNKAKHQLVLSSDELPLTDT